MGLRRTHEDEKRGADADAPHGARPSRPLRGPQAGMRPRRPRSMQPAPGGDFHGRGLGEGDIRGPFESALTRRLSPAP